MFGKLHEGIFHGRTLDSTRKTADCSPRRDDSIRTTGATYGEKSVELMLEKLNNPDAKERDEYLTAKMLVRESAENQADKTELILGS